MVCAFLFWKDSAKLLFIETITFYAPTRNVWMPISLHPHSVYFKTSWSLLICRMCAFICTSKWAQGSLHIFKNHFYFHFLLNLFICFAFFCLLDYQSSYWFWKCFIHREVSYFCSGKIFFLIYMDWLMSVFILEEKLVVRFSEGSLLLVSSTYIILVIRLEMEKELFEEK